jgi:hypothetical protein
MAHDPDLSTLLPAFDFYKNTFSHLSKPTDTASLMLLGNLNSLKMIRFLPGDEVVEIVPKIVGTVDPTVSVEYSEIGCLSPFGAVFGPSDIQNYSHSILVIVPDRALVR